jgi:Mg-chelatase subunit ChlD
MAHRATALILVLAAILWGACDDGTEERPVVRGPKPAAEPEVYRSEVDEGLGAAVVLLIDTSGSMNDKVPGGSWPKWKVANDAIGRMLEATDAFRVEHPDHRIRVGVMHFSGQVSKVLPVEDYSKERVSQALARIPKPAGDTAIGVALDAARKELYRSGCIRKYILVITDGENTRGIEPEPVAREIHKRSEGAVAIYFVAFDTDPAKFAFLRQVGGDVVSAKSEAQLSSALEEIYEGRILAEAITDIETPIEKR